MTTDAWNGINSAPKKLGSKILVSQVENYQYTKVLAIRKKDGWHLEDGTLITPRLWQAVPK